MTEEYTIIQIELAKILEATVTDGMKYFSKHRSAGPLSARDQEALQFLEKTLNEICIFTELGSTKGCIRKIAELQLLLAMLSRQDELEMAEWRELKTRLVKTVAQSDPHYGMMVEEFLQLSLQDPVSLLILKNEIATGGGFQTPL